MELSFVMPNQQNCGFKITDVSKYFPELVICILCLICKTVKKTINSLNVVLDISLLGKILVGETLSQL